MKQLLRRMSSAELQELVDLVAGCTCSLNESDKATVGEKIVQTETKEYFDTIIFNFETITDSVKSYKQSIEEYALEKDRDYAELQLELSSLREIKAKGYKSEKAAIEKLNKKIKDLSDLIKTKSAGGTKKKKPGVPDPKKPGVPDPKKPGPAAPKPPAPAAPKPPAPAAPKPPAPAAPKPPAPAAPKSPAPAKPPAPAAPKSPAPAAPKPSSPAKPSAPAASQPSAAIVATGAIAAGLITSRPKNVRLGPAADLSAVDSQLLSRFYAAAKEFGEDIYVSSGYRSDEYQTQLIVRKKLGEPNIHSPAPPKKTTTITYKGKQYTEKGSGKGSQHGRGGALDVSTANMPKFDRILAKFGLNRPHAAFDRPHVELTNRERANILIKTAMDVQYRRESGGGKKLRVLNLKNAETIGGAYHLSNAARLDTFNNMSKTERDNFIKQTGFTSSPTLEQLVNKEGTNFLSDKAKLADKLLAEQYIKNSINRLTEKFGGKLPELHDIRGEALFGPAGYAALLKDAKANPKMTFEAFYNKHPNFPRADSTQFHGKTIGEYKSVLIEQTQVRPESKTNPALTQSKTQNLRKQEKTRTVILPVILGYK